MNIEQELSEIKQMLRILVQQKTVKEWYTTGEVREILGRSEWTVREWCRLGRVNAEKRLCGRGNALEWIISHAELQRIRNEGLLPDPQLSRRRA